MFGVIMKAMRILFYSNVLKYCCKTNKCHRSKNA
jgi:hypothetical protein